MIIPVRCFTCNMVIASKYRRYLEIINSGGESSDEDSGVTLSDEGKPETLTQKAFRDLEINRYCCKRHLLTHIDLVDKI